MATELDVVAQEDGTYIVDMAFTDEDDNPITPVTGLWSLTDYYGNAINSRTDVTISPLAASVSVVLKGDDLAIPDGLDVDVDRYFRFEGTYNSSLGNGLPLTEEAKFTITNHRAVD